MYECCLCGGSEFSDFAGRSGAQCRNCKSLERSRIIGLIIKYLSLLKPGMRILHFAPEKCLHDLIEKSKPLEYIKADIRESVEGIKVTHFDIPTQIATLPSNHFDLIIHNHVLEHIRCSDIYVMFHIHRALKPKGSHIFSVPIWPGKSYACDFNELRPDVLQEKFGQNDHVAIYGSRDFHIGFGACLSIGPDYSIEQIIPSVDLDRNNIHGRFRLGLNGSSVFIKKKEDWAFNL